MRSSFSGQLESFRNLLTNRQILNLSAMLEAEILFGQIEKEKLHITIVTPDPRAAVFVLKRGATLHLVGGHWLRKGEPTADFMRKIHREFAKIMKGAL